MIIMKQRFMREFQEYSFRYLLFIEREGDNAAMYLHGNQYPTGSSLVIRYTLVSD